MRLGGEKYRLWMQPVFTALDTQQSVSNSETNTCKGVSAHVAGSTTQGTCLLSQALIKGFILMFTLTTQTFLDLLAGRLYFLIETRQLNQIPFICISRSMYEVSDCIFHVLYINFNTFRSKIASSRDFKFLLRGKHYKQKQKKSWRYSVRKKLLDINKGVKIEKSSERPKRSLALIPLNRKVPSFKVPGRLVLQLQVYQVQGIFYLCPPQSRTTNPLHSSLC